MNVPDWLGLAQQAEQLLDANRLDEARGLAERALERNPNAALAHQVLGVVWLERGRPEDARVCLEKALALRGDLVRSHHALGWCCFLFGDLDRALEHFNTALYLQPDYRFAHFNRAFVWLKRGRFREGWAEYEWRWFCNMLNRPEIPCPRWDGAPLGGRSILVHTEQGIGDVIQFIRFLPMLKRQPARVVLACQKALHALLRPMPYVDEWFPIDEPGKITFDLYSPLLSLPGLLGIEEEAAIPQAIPYIAAEPERIQRWRQRIRSLPGFKIGICWQGSPTYKSDRIRSIPLEFFTKLAQVPAVTLVSLQKGPGVEQIEQNRQRLPVQLLGDLDRDAAFVDTAAVMHHLDLVLTSDTAIAHLAGALGRPVWTLLSTGCDWRWLVGRTDSPWYPTMRLFRQEAFGDWAGVFQKVAVALRGKV